MNALKKLYCPDNGGWEDGIHTFKSEEFEIVKTLSYEYPVYLLCTVMGVSKSGYYKWLDRCQKGQDTNRKEVIELVACIHAEHRTHGYRWVHWVMLK